jgi:transcriptional regulator with XRE-family HTH domain
MNARAICGRCAAFMPKSVDIEDFSAKLGLVAKRLDWSRAKLAQQVGIDKSLAGRWLKGDSRPTPYSLTRLTAALAQTLTGLTADDWQLPIDRFALRVGTEPPVAIPSDNSGSRLTIAGLKFPPAAEWGEPYLGLWAGFYQSVINKGLVRLCALHFFIDDLGLRCRLTEGNFTGEGPALATRSHLQCLFDVGPLYDRMAYCMFNGVHAPKAAIIDGLVCVIAADSGGSPVAAPILLFRIDEDTGDTEIETGGIAAAIRQVHERAANEIARTGDMLAVFRDLAPPEVLRAVTPMVGDGRDHVLRMPAARSLAASTLSPDESWRQIAANLRRALGLDRDRPQLRLLGAVKT